ncbi:Dip2/Utp12 family-domain-containing protein [Cryomyces antarcticus]
MVSPTLSRKRQSAVSLPTSSAKKSKTPQNSHVPPAKSLKSILDDNADGRAFEAISTNGVKDTDHDTLDESRTVVAGKTDVNGDVDMHDVGAGKGAPVEISSDEEESSTYESSDEEVVEGVTKPPSKPKVARKDATTEDDAVMADGEEEADGVGVPAGPAEEQLAEEPTFGEILRANAGVEPIDVEASFVDPMAESRALASTSGYRTLVAPSATSLGTVLTQALKTNDSELLEFCFQMTDVDSIRSTIQRLHSSLVSNLLQKLAERLHRRPGRAGNLMVWVQWSLVAHGGYLASQPEVMKKLGTLHRVIKERANGLQPLLTLKGKLDMLSAQIELRKSMQASARAADEEDEDERIVYVEGEESEPSEEEADDEPAAIEVGVPTPKQPGKGGKLQDYQDPEASESSEDDGDDMPTTANGVVADSEDDSSDGGDDGLIDDEAEETDDDTGDDSSEDGEDVELDDVSASSDSEMEAPPPKRTAVAPRKPRQVSRRTR